MGRFCPAKAGVEVVAEHLAVEAQRVVLLEDDEGVEAVELGDVGAGDAVRALDAAEDVGGRLDERLRERVFAAGGELGLERGLVDERVRATGAQRVEEGAAAGDEVGDADDPLGEGRFDGAEVALDPGPHGIGRDDPAFDGVDAEDAVEERAFRLGEPLRPSPAVRRCCRYRCVHAAKGLCRDPARRRSSFPPARPGGYSGSQGDTPLDPVREGAEPLCDSPCARLRARDDCPSCGPPAPLLVLEVALAGEDHRHVVRVGGGDGFVVADGAAGLDDGGDARFGGRLDAVREREEGVGGHDGALRPVAGARAASMTLVTRLGWPAPMPTSAESFTKTMAFDLMCLTAVGEEEVAHLRVGRLALRDDLRLDLRVRDVVALLHEEAADDPPVVEAGQRGRRRAQDAQVALLAQEVQRLVVVVGRDDDLVERLADLLGDGQR